MAQNLMTEKIEFVRVETANDIFETARIADIVWREHYTDLLGEGQVSYMIEKFQSADAISKQIESDDYSYFLMKMMGHRNNDKYVGYFGVQPEKDYLFLSKLYVLHDFRGRGFATQALCAVKSFAESFGLNRIRLTVNKGNVGSIAVYKHWGFKEIDSIITDIGCGYVMDDYVMELEI